MAERIVWPDGAEEEFDPAEIDYDELLPERSGSRKPKRLTRRPKSPKINPRKARVDIGGIVAESEWQRLRQDVFRRDRWRCVRCGKRSQALQCHHRKLQAQGGPDIAWNLITLCAACHGWCHNHPALAQQGGWIVPGWADPRPRAVLLHTGELALLSEGDEYAWKGRP